MLRKLKKALRLFRLVFQNRQELNQYLGSIQDKNKAIEFLRKFNSENQLETQENVSTKIVNPLWDYFKNNKEGNGIWKWEHYFDIYHTHFKKFIGEEVKVLEIGIYSGGSLGMWRTYFGDKCKIYGIDIEEACKIYENDYTEVFIGDQEDRSFWKTLFDQIGSVDIIIDDGGHTTEQQRITLEETLNKINPGGIYLCEDVHRENNRFAEYTKNFVDEMNKFKVDPKKKVSLSDVTRFQATIKSICYYPYVIVIEKNEEPITKLSAPKHGTVWQPFFD